jgi:N-ethylmaleimide reductase
MDGVLAGERAQPALQSDDTAFLFKPYRLGPFNLRHRVVMAPLTRSHARQLNSEWKQYASAFIQ